MLRTTTSRFAPASSSSVIVLATVLLIVARPAHSQARALPNRDTAVELHIGDTARGARGDPRHIGLVAAGDTVRLFAGKTELARGILLGSDSTNIGAGALLIAASSQTHGSEDYSMLVGMLAAGLSGTIGIATGAFAALTYADVWYPFNPQSLAVRIVDQ